jgi:peptidoglycan hydrolase CwlO-like protein
MRNLSPRIKIVATAAFLVLGVASANIVQASTTPSPTPRAPRASLQAAEATLLSTIKTKCDTAVKTRVSALQGDITKINSDATITSSDKASLLATASSDISGLQSLDTTIQGDTTVQQARSDCQKIVNDYRVFVLFEPQVHLTISTDRLTVAVAKVQVMSSKLATIVGKITDPTQKAAAQAALTDFNSKLAAAQSSLGGLSGVLGLTPSDYPGNKSALQSLQSALQAIRGDLQALRGDIRTIRDAVKASPPTPGGSPSPTPSV